MACRATPGPAVLMLLLASLPAAACRAGPDARYWSAAAERPRPYPAMAFSPAWETPLPFCPTAVAETETGAVLRRDGRALVLRGDDGVLVPLPGERPSTPPAASSTVWQGRGFRLTEAGSVEAYREADGKRLWRVRPAAAVIVPPQLYHGRLLVQSLDNFVYCLRARDGHELWRTRTSHRLRHPAVFWGDRILLIPETAARVQAFDLFDGSRAGDWEIPGAGRRFVAGPVVHGNLLMAVHAPLGVETCAAVGLALAEAGRLPPALP